MTPRAFGLWRKLPVPAKLATAFAAVMAVIWVRNWLGSAAIVLAILFWALALIGMLHASGRLGWVDRQARLLRLLDSFAPRQSLASPLPMSAPVPASPSPQAKSPPKPDPTPVTTVRLDHLVGLAGVFQQVDRLIATRASWTSTVAPATLVLLVGPRGTGKSSVAIALASELKRLGTLRSDKIVVLSPSETPGLTGSFGPSETALTAVKDRIQSALDGTLIIDDLAALTGSGDAPPIATEIGLRLLEVTRLYPRRLFVVATGSKDAAGRLDPSNRWLGRFNIRRIEFTDLDTKALEDLFTRLLSDRNLKLADNAGPALRIQIEERQKALGANFDNAYAVFRLVDDVVQTQALRVHQNPSLAADTKRTITAEDVRSANASL